MIVKSIVVGIFITSLFAFIIYANGNTIPTWGFPHWNHDNVGKTEKVAFHAPSTNIILCGSSISYLMEPYLPREVYSLSITGGSPLTGMQLINQLNLKPKIVGIEINYLERSVEDTYLTHPLYSGFSKEIKDLFPFMRTYYQPINAIGYLISKNNIKVRDAYKITNPGHIGKTIENMLLPGKIKIGKELRDSATVNNTLKPMLELTRKITAQGIKVVFYEIPMNPLLMRTPRYKQLIEAFQDSIKLLEIPVTFIPAPKYSGWKTVDGDHLETASSRVYTEWLMKRIN
jgi:hypothetical protein